MTEKNINDNNPAKPIEEPDKKDELSQENEHRSNDGEQAIEHHFQNEGYDDERA